MMTVTALGYSGTQKNMIKEQSASVEKLLAAQKPLIARHGDRAGAERRER